MPTRHTPYHQRFVELGAEMGDRIGFDAAVVFTSTQQEHMATREAVGLYDVYYQGPIDIKGPDAQRCSTTCSRATCRGDWPRTARSSTRRSATTPAAWSTTSRPTGSVRSTIWLIATPARAEAVDDTSPSRRATVART